MNIKLNTVATSLFSIIGCIGLVMFSLNYLNDNINFLPTLGLWALSTFFLIPFCLQFKACLVNLACFSIGLICSTITIAKYIDNTLGFGNLFALFVIYIMLLYPFYESVKDNIKLSKKVSSF